MRRHGGSTEQILADLAPLGDAERLQASGGLVLVSPADVVQIGQPIVPEERAGALAQLTERAIADGYSGRLAVDATAVVGQVWPAPEQTRVEHLSDHYIADGHPVALLCAYHRRTTW